MGEVTSRTGSIAKLMMILHDILPCCALIELFLAWASMTAPASISYALKDQGPNTMVGVG
jgi:hypothetical protein